MPFASSSFSGRWNGFGLLLLALAYSVAPDSFCALALPENKSTANNHGNLPPHRQHPREEYAASKSGGNNGDNNNNDDKNGILQIIETEVWDASENVWKGAAAPGMQRGNRWTNERGQVSPSPAEVVPPPGWNFLGDWKIVVSSSSSANSNSAGMGAGGDSKGWEYQFQYLQPPRRRRIWLRSLTPTRLPPVQPKSSRLQPPITTKVPPKVERTDSRIKAKKSLRTRRLMRTMRQIRDDWNYKGMGFNLYKSFIFPSTIGVSLRIPLSIHFDTFDRNPSWPIISSSASVFYPPMVGGFLSTSVHVEWVKWMTKCTLALIPRSIFWILYRLVLPVLWAIASAIVVPFKGVFTLPPRPIRIPSGSWWTGGNIAKPQYNPEMSERIGCSVSYRWSQKRGYEFRVNYWHSYLPTMLLYQKFLSQWQQRLNGSIASGSSSRSSSPTSSSSVSRDSEDQPKTTTNWWRKHTASLGVITGGPIPDTPHVSCSANLSLSGLYWGAGQVVGGNTIAKPTIAAAAASRKSGAIQAMSDRDGDTSIESERDYGERTGTSTRVAPIMKSSSVS